jgi:hypothetical protein
MPFYDPKIPFGDVIKAHPEAGGQITDRPSSGESEALCRDSTPLRAGLGQAARLSLDRQMVT